MTEHMVYAYALSKRRLPVQTISSLAYTLPMAFKISNSHLICLINFKLAFKYLQIRIRFKRGGGKMEGCGSVNLTQPTA